MIRPVGALALCLALLATPAAPAVDTTPRPAPRPEAAAPAGAIVRERVVRPAPRPAELGAPVGARGEPARRRTAARGAICGDGAIRGRALPRVAGRLDGCGIAGPVRVRSVAGVQLSRPATLDCRTAKALKRWVRQELRPVVGSGGGGPSELRVVADYSCRRVNSQPDADISEHGRGRAIDIAAIRLRDGTRLSVRDGWGEGRAGRLLRRLHRAACGIFGTVLGPEADRYHRDHFHFDTARYRGGSYCR